MYGFSSIPLYHKASGYSIPFGKEYPLFFVFGYCLMQQPHFLYLSGLVESVVVCVCVAKGGATHMTTLEDLYYGNISPHERYIKRGTRVDRRNWIAKLIVNESYTVEKRLYIINKILSDFFRPFSSVTQLDVFFKT